MSEDAEHRRLVIAGSGIAGLSAAIYAARSNNDPLVLEGPEPGGQLTLTTDVANYPGFPEGIGGPELIQNMKAQAEQFGTEIDTGVIADVDPGTPHRIELRDGTVYTADALIAASGASARTLGVPGEDELMGYGVSTCATCDGAFFRDEDMIVVGGGDAACEEATFLTKFADTVSIVHRREEFRAEDYWIDRVRELESAGEIEVLTNTELLEIDGSPEEGVESVTLARNPEGHPGGRGAWGAPHFDVHFHMLDTATIDAIEGPNPAPYDGIADEKIPTGYNRSPPPAAAERYITDMGEHLAPGDAPELPGNPEAFTNTLIQGFVGVDDDPQLAFVEPMVTREFLREFAGTEQYDVAQPAVYPHDEQHPTAYSVRADPSDDTVVITLEGFEQV